MAERLKLGVLISGRGSNLQALIDACKQPDFPAEIVLVVSNKASAFGLERAHAARIPTAVINHKDYDGREAFDAAVTKALEASGVQLVCLAGFMRLLTESFTTHWHDRLINIHPSLLPKYKGLDTHARALAAGESEAGCTIHFVRPAMDEGPIIMQAAVPILPNDTEDSLAARVLEQEHRCYPEAVRLIAEGNLRIVDEQVVRV